MKTIFVVRLPKALVAEVRRLGPRRLRGLPAQAVAWALERWVDRRREERVDREMEEMGKDPQVLAECRRINQEGPGTDRDGQKGL